MKKNFLLMAPVFLYIQLNAQNAGIGTTTPQQKLDVHGIIRTDSGIMVKNILMIAKGKVNADTGLFKMVGINKVPDFDLDVNGIINTANLFAINGNNAVRFGISNSLYVGISGYFNTGANNTMIGQAAGGFNANVSSDNTFVGNNAGGNNTSGSFNSIVGSNAGLAITTGANNTMMGYQAGQATSTGQFNTFIGYKAGLNTNSQNNTFVGDNSGLSNTSGVSNIFIGSSAGLLNKTGSYNVLVGGSAGVFSTASRNTMMGNATGLQTNTGGDNTFYGNDAGYNNTTGAFNTIIGSFADVSAGSNFSNSTAIGYQAQVTAGNQVRIGNSSITSIGGFQPWSNISDGRFKKNIQQNVPGLSFINKLRPVTYCLDFEKINKQQLKKDNTGGTAIAYIENNSPNDNKESQKRFTGFVAQEVEQSAAELKYEFDGVDAPKNEQDFYSLRYSEFVVPLVKAVQELSVNNDAKENNINQLASKVNELETKNTALQQQLLKMQEQINAIKKGK